MKILYFGTSIFAQPALSALLTHGHDVVGVVTQPDRPAGRGGKLTFPPMKEFALAHNLSVLQPESCRAPEFLHTIHQLVPDLNVVAAYGQFLPDALLTLPRYGSVNLHGSLLPKFRGAAPIQRAIWAGDTESGICLMWMARGMDAGDVIACAQEDIRPEDTAGSLSARLAECAADLLLQWLPAIERGTAPHHPQDPTAVTFAPAISKEERHIDWSQSAMAIANQVRALAPTPAAVTGFRGQTMKLFDARPVASPTEEKRGEPGEVVEIEPRTGFVVATGAGELEIRSLQPAGKRLMSGADFLRGYRIVRGERFSGIMMGG